MFPWRNGFGIKQMCMIVSGNWLVDAKYHITCGEAGVLMRLMGCMGWVNRKISGGVGGICSSYSTCSG